MSDQSVRYLKSLAKKKGIKGYYKMKKAGLLKELGIEESMETTRKTMSQKREITDLKLMNYYCIHGKYKYHCKDCKNDKQLYLCKDCGGKGICEHNRQSNICKGCKGKGICEHFKQIYFSIDCRGKGICKHEKRKDYCEYCSNILNPEKTD